MTAAPAQNRIPDDQWYVEHVLPSLRSGQEGRIVIAHTKGPGHWKEKDVGSPEEAVAEIRRVAADPSVIGVFAAQGLMRSDPDRRRHRNLAVAFNSVWLDLDAKDFEQAGDPLPATVQRMRKSLTGFYTAVGLPCPSVVLWTGGGMHAFWAFDQSVTKVQWEAVARNLQMCAEHRRFPADIQCTTDAARVLRVPGTLNGKSDYAKPRRTAVLFPDTSAPPARHNPEDLASVLLAYMSAHQAVPRTSSVVQLHGFERRPPLTGISDLAAGLDLNLDEIRSAVAAIPSSAIGPERDWMRFARGLAHTAAVFEQYAEQLWIILDEASQQAPNYDSAENRQRWERYVQETIECDEPITIRTVFQMAKSAGWQGWSPPLAAITHLSNGTAGGQATARAPRPAEVSTLPSLREL